MKKAAKVLRVVKYENRTEVLNSCEKGVMPLNETCVVKLQEFFEYYECLSFEEWAESVEDILEEVTAYQEACAALVKIHEDMMTVLKQREDTANVRASKNKTLFRLKFKLSMFFRAKNQNIFTNI